MKVLWLTSWYPNRLDAANGDFIQRHAKAVSLFCDVHVIHLEPDKNDTLTAATEVSIYQEGSLTEEIVLYKLCGMPVIGRLLSYMRYIARFKKHIRAYLQQHGPPVLVHVHVPMKAGILAMWLKRKYGVPYVVTEHWAIYNDYAPDAFEKKSLVFKNFTRKILKEAAMFLPVSDDLGKAVIRMAIKVPYIVVPNVADTTLFNYETMHQRPFTFFHASTLGYQKNPGAILRAFKKFLRVNPQSRLVMAGYAGEWPGYANELGIPARNVEFTGFIPYVQVAMLMKQADVLVMFSRYENLPCVIIEALCCGLPVISSNVGGISEIVNQSNGMLVPAGNEDTLLQALIQMYMNRQQYNRAYIAQNAAALYAYSVIGQQVAGIYQSVIDKNITLVGNKH